MALGAHLPNLSRTATVAFAALPAVVPAIYLLYLHYRVSQVSTTCSGRRQRSQSPAPSSISASVRRPVTLPPEVERDDSEWVLSYERVVSKPLKVSALMRPISSCEEVGAPPDLVTIYSRATHTAFSWTPQAFIIRGSIKDDEIRRTFDSEYIGRLDFNVGDLVKGGYRVAYHGDGGVEGCQRVELALEAPPGYRGPLVRGIIAAGVERVEDEANGPEEEQSVRLVNETWMWRLESEKPALLEGAAFRWVHSLMAGWFVVKGINALTAKDSKEE